MLENVKFLCNIFTNDEDVGVFKKTYTDQIESNGMTLHQEDSVAQNGADSPVAEGVFACMRETENFSSDFVYIHPKM